MITTCLNHRSLHLKLLSVVIPAYNVEKYINQCLHSFVVKRILPFIEVLIINDGSNDATYDMAAAYERQYPDTFKVITKQNGGHGSAINMGIKEATGKYFKVVDGDDWVDPQALTALIETLRISNSDVVFHNFYWVDESTGNRKAEMKEHFAGVQYHKEYLFSNVCQKLYMKMHSMTIKTQVLQNHQIFLDEKCFYVDTEYILYPIPHINTITFVPDFVYQYRVGQIGQSVNIWNMQLRMADHLKVLDSVIRFYLAYKQSQNPENQKEQYILRLINRVIASQYKIFLSFEGSASIKRRLMVFDDYIKNSDIDLYNGMGNPAIHLLRKSRFCLYPLASLAVRMKYSKGPK